MALTDVSEASPVQGQASIVAPAMAFVVVYLVLLLAGDRLLNDADAYWHLTVGRWIVEHRAFPTQDLFSFSFAGQPWIAKEWLSQLIFAGAHSIGGWTGMVVVAAGAVGLGFALLASRLQRSLGPLPMAAMLAAAFLLTAPHIVARPHVLAFPIVVLWMGWLLDASGRGGRPPFLALPLMVLWANLHGGFALGLALVAPIALEAILAAPADRRLRIGLAWIAFGLLAGCMALVTPYGPQTALAAYKVLSLGAAQSVIEEWKPQDFSAIEGFEVVLLAGVGLAFAHGVRLPPMRLVMLLGLLHLALSHARNADFLGLIAPLLLAAPLAGQFARLRPEAQFRAAAPAARLAIIMAALAGALAASTLGFQPAANISPVAAVDALKRSGAARTFNGYDFGGYLIAAGVPPFIDGRTELYGADFTVAYHDAAMLKDLPGLLQLLEDWRIDSTLLPPQAPAVAWLDRSSDWRRVYGDVIAVVHVRARP